MSTTQNTQTTTTTSKRWTLNWRDFGKGLITAAITATLPIIETAIRTQSLNTVDWKQIGYFALYGGLGYLIKNLLTDSQIVIQNPKAEAVQAVKDGKAEAEIVHTGSGIPTLDLNKPTSN